MINLYVNIQKVIQDGWVYTYETISGNSHDFQTVPTVGSFVNIEGKEYIVRKVVHGIYTTIYVHEDFG